MTPAEPPSSTMRRDPNSTLGPGNAKNCTARAMSCMVPGRYVRDESFIGMLTPEHTFPAPMQDMARAVQFLLPRPKSGIWIRGAWWSWAVRRELIWPPGLVFTTTWPNRPARTRSRASHTAQRLGPPFGAHGPDASATDRVGPATVTWAGLRQRLHGAFACTPEQYEQAEAIRGKVREASPLFLVSRDDPPAFIMGGAGAEMSVGNHPPVPAVINDPHSAWHGMLLADALAQAGVSVTCRLGPQVGKNPELDNAAILDFLRIFFSPQPATHCVRHHGAAFQLQPDRQNSRLRNSGHCPRGLFSSFQAPPQLDRIAVAVPNANHFPFRSTRRLRLSGLVPLRLITPQKTRSNHRGRIEAAKPWRRSLPSQPVERVAGRDWKVRYCRP